MKQELTKLQKVIKQSLVVIRTESGGINISSVLNIMGDDEDTRVTIKNELEYFYKREFLTYQQLQGMV